MRLKERLRALCQSWGGDLVYMSREEFGRLCDGRRRIRNGFYDAPFTDALGSFWRKKVIVYTSRKGRKRHHGSAIIHEMGHTFASKKNPEHVDEFDFFGWELCVAKHVGLATHRWLYGNRDYLVSDGTGGGWDIGSLIDPKKTAERQADWEETPPNLKSLLQKRIEFARKTGIVQGTTPVSIR